MTEKQIQCLLFYLGYYKGSIDGNIGAGSTVAIKSFQTDAGLETDGICGKDTQKALTDAVAHGVFAKSGVVVSTPTVATGTFWDEIKYFTRTEFKCPCSRCGGFPGEPAEDLVRILDSIREYFGAPITVSSGVRCQEHNDELSGSVKNSRHVPTQHGGVGKATDFCIKGKTATQIKSYCDTLVSTGKLRYCYCIDSSYVHIDIL